MSTTRPKFIKNCNDFKTDSSGTYPGDSETFGADARLAKELGLKRIAINYGILEPGDRSSWPHAHSEEEEFIFILEGNGQVWVDGLTHNVRDGDCIAFPPATGIYHCLINNSDAPVRFLVVGEQNAKSDRVFYPKHPKRNAEVKNKGWFWDGHPVQELGPHDGWSDKKRPK